MQLTPTKTGYTLMLTQAEAEKVTEVLLKMAEKCNRSTLDFTYLTAEAVLSMKNTFKQPKSFYQGVSHAS